MNVLTKAAAGIALSLAFAVPAMAGLCSSQTTLTGLGPPGSATFSQSFNSTGNRGDCYTFNLSAPANSVGSTTALDFSFFLRDIAITGVSLFGGGVSGNNTQGLALYSDSTPASFSFATTAAGLYTLQIFSNVTGSNIFPISGGSVGYEGTITTRAATAAVPEPASLALLGLGLLGLGFARRKTNS